VRRVHRFEHKRRAATGRDLAVDRLPDVLAALEVVVLEDESVRMSFTATNTDSLEVPS
jgi:hypothetical protein